MASPSEIVLGITYGHGDSSAALIVNHQLVAAVEEERFTRIKHCASFPTHAIAYCLKHAKIEAKDIGYIAVGQQPLNQLWYRMQLGLSHPQILSQYLMRRPKQPKLHQLLADSGLGNATVIRVEHHLAHLMSARFLSNADSQAFMSFDGLGDFVSVAIGRTQGNQIEVLDRIRFPHSLGFYYTAMTQYLGFPHFGDEFKVMGLAPYGQPKYLAAMRECIRETEPFGFKLNLEAFPILRHPLKFQIRNEQPEMAPFYNANFLTQIIGVAPRKQKDNLDRQHWDLARSIQQRFEEVANTLLHQLHRRVETKNLALSGGCSHNSVWVGKIPALTPFKNVVLAPASHDAGIAVGAAIYAANRPIEAENGNWALLGPDENDYDLGILHESLESRQAPSRTQLLQTIAESLANGQIVGLFHGRMEFGPRALGSRSILCDPRASDAKDKLNARVKHREAFRPFAASVLSQYQRDWFQQSFESPYMEAVFDVKNSMKHRIPAVVHTDGTCRIQSVTKALQPFYYDLIEAFRKKTSIPMLLNTSFNDCEPIVCTPQDAIRCFQNCEMDLLVIGNHLITRANALKKSA